MDIHKLIEIIKQGESDRVEFKESKTQLTSDVLDTVCSFSNHTGGHLLLGVRDDRDVIITNLLDSYDRLMKFGQKHLSDPFILDGIQSVSARDAILREIFSNILAHRDYSSGLTAKFVIEKNRMYTENANLFNHFRKPADFKGVQRNWSCR